MSDIIPELSPLAKAFKPGIYQHFKGGLYEAICVGRSSEARSEEFVVYKSLDKGYIWIRPIEMFFEDVDKAEYKGPRFIYLRDKA